MKITPISADTFVIFYEDCNMTWEEKAGWLQKNGYPLVINALGQERGQVDNWVASIGGRGRRYSVSIADAVDQVYEWVTSPIE